MSSTQLPSGVLHSVQVGMPRSYGSEGAVDSHDQPWTTGFFKSPVNGRVFVGATNLVGDGQADLENHGGPDKAALAYSADHYPRWRDEFHMPDMPYGAFGENLTIADLSEESVCIGDVLRIGELTLEVSQPRQPCWKLARRWRMHELVSLVILTGRTGWYLRVLEEGWVESQMPVTIIERHNPAWSIARANSVLHHSASDLRLTLDLASVPKLAYSWVEELRERAGRLRAPSAAI